MDENAEGLGLASDGNLPATPEEPVEGQGTLFGGDGEFHRHWSEWKGLPPYESEMQAPHSSILVHFLTVQDREAFTKLVAQPISSLTRSIYYPRADWDHVANLRWKADQVADAERRKMGQTGALYHGKRLDE